MMKNHARSLTLSCVTTVMTTFLFSALLLIPTQSLNVIGPGGSISRRAKYTNIQHGRLSSFQQSLGSYVANTRRIKWNGLQQKQQWLHQLQLTQTSTADDYLNNTFLNDTLKVSDIATNPLSMDNTAAVDENVISSPDSNMKGTKVVPYTKLMIFVATTILIWLSEPLLSLVDTTAVGKFASGLSVGKYATNGVAPETLQLAALGPATMVCDNAFYLVYFLAIAVTNQLASSSGKSDGSVQVKTTSHALGIASILGGLITLIMFGFGGGILKYIIGNGGFVNGINMAPSLIASAWDYIKIRGFLAPLTVMGMIAQAVCLATLDTKTPAIAVLVASVLNVFGDYLLVAKFKMGLQGAALATAVAGAGSSLLLLLQTKKKFLSWKKLSGDQKKLPSFISLPDPKSFMSLVKLAGPIFFVLVGKIICYSSMTKRASDFEMMSLATHNIMIRVFFFFCTFGDGFSLAAQSFIPQVLYKEAKDDKTPTQNSITANNDNVDDVRDGILKSPSRENKLNAKYLLKQILLLSTAMAVGNAWLIKTAMQNWGTFFTNDPTILSLLASPTRVFYISISTFLHPIIMALEGSILATRDLGFLVAAYGGTMVCLLSLLQFATSSFTGVWRMFFVFQLIRFTTFGYRVYSKSRVEMAT